MSQVFTAPMVSQLASAVNLTHLEDGTSVEEGPPSCQALDTSERVNTDHFTQAHGAYAGVRAGAQSSSISVS